MLTWLLALVVYADVEQDLAAQIAKPYDPGAYTRELQSRSLELQPELPGRLYGAVAWKIIDQPIAKVRAYFAQMGAIFQVVAAVKTQRDLVKVAEAPNALELQLAIKVPVVRDYHTQDKIKFEDGRMEWRQSAPEGQLQFNQGYVLVTPEGDDACRVFVMGVHLIKPENRVPWIGRGTAARFAREHYAGYITALESVLR